MKTLIAGISLVAMSLPVAAQTCSCGPTYCIDDAAFTKSIAAKKATAAAGGAPARLLVLYDRLERCSASASMAPDGFSIVFQRPGNGSISVDRWTAENERNDAAAVAAAGKGACYVVLARKAFPCCGGTPAEQRPDYDSTLEMNKDLALPCQL